MPYASVGDMRLFYAEAGAGIPVLLAHGGFSDISEWQPQGAPLSERYRVIRYDRRGCGRSQPREVPQDPDLWVEDQAQLIKELGLERPVIAGVSYGGMLLLEFLLKYSELCRAAVIVSASARGVKGRVPFPDRTAELATIDTPTLVVQGSQDGHFTPELGEELASGLPNACLAVLDGGHTINNQRIQEFNQAMLSFLDEVADAG